MYNVSKTIINVHEISNMIVQAYMMNWTKKIAKYKTSQGNLRHLFNQPRLINYYS